MERPIILDLVSTAAYIFGAVFAISGEISLVKHSLKSGVIKIVAGACLVCLGAMLGHEHGDYLRLNVEPPFDAEGAARLADAIAEQQTTLDRDENPSP